MGNFFTSTQIYNEGMVKSEKFIDMFCKAMKKEGYVTCEGDESEKTYILRFTDNCKWVTITSEDYEQGNQTAHSDTGRIAQMLGTTCVNTTVIDSDCAVMEMYNEKGVKADTLIMGRADDYFGENIPLPAENAWKPFLADNSSWKKLCDIVKESENYTFVEEGLSELATLIGMDENNISFSAEEAEEDEQTVFLFFKEARSAITMSQGGKNVEKPNKKLTINAAFKQVFGEALKPYGFKAIKGRYPYLVRVINNEILHIITFYPTDPEYPYDKGIAVVGGVATIYRKRISFDKSPKQNHEWLNYIFNFFALSPQVTDINKTQNIDVFYYSSDNQELMISVLEASVESVKKYVLPEFDKIKDIDSCLDYFEKLMGPCNPLRCEEVCSYYPDEDEAFLYFLSDKRISEHHDFLENYLNDSEFHKWVLNEIEKRKRENTDILKTLGIID